MASASSNQQPEESNLRRPSFQRRSSSSQTSANALVDSVSQVPGGSPVLLNDPLANERDGVPSPLPSTFPSRSRQQDVRRCWICQMDETEDTPESSVWRSPCPCSLVAHDECLLEWIADGEAPKDGGAASTQKFFCPVCKAEIHIERPRDALVALYDQVQGAAKSLAYPTAISALLGCGYAGLFAYGVNTLYLVFGREEAVKILAAMRGRQMYDWSGRFLGERYQETIGALIANADPFFPRIDLIGWRGFVALPMIAPSLVLSRSSLGRFVFPLMISGVSCLYQLSYFATTYNLL
jgi:hypothetical protein